MFLLSKNSVVDLQPSSLSKFVINFSSALWVNLILVGESAPTRIVNVWLALEEALRCRPMLDVLSKEEFGLLAWHLRHGVYSISNYSGTGFLEMAMQVIQKTATSRKEFIWTNHRGFRSISACDKEKRCRQSLMALSQFDHIFGDQWDRLPHDIRQKCDELTWPTKQEILQQAPQETVEQVQNVMFDLLKILEEVNFLQGRSWCEIHEKDCKTAYAPKACGGLKAPSLP